MELQQNLLKKKKNGLNNNTVLKQENGENEIVQKILSQASSRFTQIEIGQHYAKALNPKRIRHKKELDDDIDEMLKSGKGLIISGPVGVGKTVDLVYITKRVIETKMFDYAKWLAKITKGDITLSVQMLVTKIRHLVSYHFAPELFNKLHSGKEVEITSFFIIDDFGRQYNEPFAVSRFEAMIEEIYRDEMTLIITTNMTPKELLQMEGWGRVTDRIREMCSVLYISGTSMRHK